MANSLCTVAIDSGNSAINCAGLPPYTVNDGTIVSGGMIVLSSIFTLSCIYTLCPITQFLPI